MRASGLATLHLNAPDFILDYEMLTGVLPFKASDPMEWDPLPCRETAAVAHGAVQADP